MRESGGRRFVTSRDRQSFKPATLMIINRAWSATARSARSGHKVSRNVQQERGHQIVQLNSKHSTPHKKFAVLLYERPTNRRKLKKTFWAQTAVYRKEAARHFRTICSLASETGVAASVSTHLSLERVFGAERRRRFDRLELFVHQLVPNVARRSPIHRRGDLYRSGRGDGGLAATTRCLLRARHGGNTQEHHWLPVGVFRPQFGN